VTKIKIKENDDIDPVRKNRIEILNRAIECCSFMRVHGFITVHEGNRIQIKIAKEAKKMNLAHDSEPFKVTLREKTTEELKND
jgi:hypothetical protein